MSESIVRHVIQHELTVPDDAPADLWPTIAARLAAREQNRAVRRVMRRGVLAALLVFSVALLISPGLRSALAEALRPIVGMWGGPGQATIFQPAPPFVVRQPGYLPPGFQPVRTLYNPGFDPQTVPTALALASHPTPSGATPLSEANALLKEIDEHADPSQAALLLIYRKAEGGELWLYERVALTSDEAGLKSDGQHLRLTWIQDGTWLALRSTLPREELLQVARGLVVTQKPDPNETGGSGFPGPMLDERVLPAVSLAEAQRQVPFAIPLPTWLPEGIVLLGAHVSPPDWAQTFYGRAEGRDDEFDDGGFGIETTYGPYEGGYTYPDASKQPVMVNGQPAICIQGAWNEWQEWNGAADTGALEWSANGFTYHIGHSNLGLTCSDLIKIAESLL